MALVLECWDKLDSQRLLGPMYPGPIPRKDVVWWCEREGCDRQLTELVADAVQYLDVERAERISSELNLKGG